jgi:hypothetical protein
MPNSSLGGGQPEPLGLMTCRAAGGIVLSARVLVDSSFAEVAGDAMRVTAACDEPWRHLAHGGRQAVEVSVTSPAPPSHSPPIAAQSLVHEVRG